jgi:hypothetical protein
MLPGVYRGRFSTVILAHAKREVPVDGSTVAKQPCCLLLAPHVHAGNRMPVDGRMFIYLCFKISISAH